MTVPALFSCSLALERGEKRNGAGVALGPAPPSAVLLRARPSCSGPRTHSRTTAGRTGAVPREPTGPGPGHRTRSFAAAFAGVRTLCVVFIQTQIRLNYVRELDARASEGSVGKCLRERSDHDHWISPRNGEQNWHTEHGMPYKYGKKCSRIGALVQCGAWQIGSYGYLSGPCKGPAFRDFGRQF